MYASFGSREKKLAKKLNVILCSDLDEIDPRFCVTASVSLLLHIIYEEFSLLSNDPKGHGKIFLEWMQEKHPGTLLLHVEHVSGSM